VDHVALVMDGTIKLFGPRDEVMRQIAAPGGAPSGPVHVVAGGRGK